MARPVKNLDGTLNLMSWDCAIPGKKGVRIFFFTIFGVCQLYREKVICRLNSLEVYNNIYAYEIVCISVSESIETNMHFFILRLCVTPSFALTFVTILN